MTAIVEGNELVIRIPLTAPTASKSGKNLIVASTHGPAKTTTLVGDKPLTINLNAYVNSK